MTMALETILPVAYFVIGLVVAAPIVRSSLGGDESGWDLKVLYAMLVGCLVILIASLWPVVGLGYLYWLIVRKRK